ncbi:30S ribosomal protein S16 [Candidatus Saccharibacteria bacterium CPR2]|nr:30S ribosomal protein S16 [Candidatus Saccharibacteria bacterium CPR2]
MLAIRMQRTGRKGHAQFRVVVQDSRRTPSSGKVAAYLGSYDPHSKKVVLNKEKAEFYLKNGAQPSPRVAVLLKSEKVKLPGWISEPAKKKRTIRNPEKLRRNQPKETKKTEINEEKPTAQEEVAEKVQASEEAQNKKEKEDSSAEESKTT